MAKTYAQLLHDQRNVIQDLQRIQGSIINTKVKFGELSAELSRLQTAYNQWVTDVNDLATANPADPAVLDLKTSKDRLMSEFQSSITEANALQVAVDGV